MSRKEIERQARYLAKDNRDVEPSISKVYWFPADAEVRLIELITEIPVSDDQRVHPFYFRGSKKHKLPFRSAIAMIRPEEFKRLELPEEWGSWTDAQEITDAG